MKAEFRANFMSPAGPNYLNLSLDTSDTSQDDVNSAFSNGKYYEHETSLLFVHTLREGDVVVDVGANVGYFTTLFGRLVGPTGHVFAVEMNPRHQQRLQAHIALNEISATILPVAIGREKGFARFSDGGDADGNGILVLSEGDGELVPIDTLDNLAEQHERLLQAKAMKIDVEGAEGWVLQGASKILAQDKLEIVIIEANPPVQERTFGVSFKQIREILHSYGFESYLMSPYSYSHDPNTRSPAGDFPVHVPIDIDIEFKLVTNIAFLRKGVLRKYWPSVVYLPARYVFGY
ncbi:MAG: FkbM family methyltransferase [Alphaproteobacteria bacterium]|nr:FkbM family methyltransferase [Alphaproteobacteria bacterium]